MADNQVVGYEEIKRAIKDALREDREEMAAIAWRVQFAIAVAQDKKLMARLDELEQDHETSPHHREVR